MVAWDATTKMVTSLATAEWEEARNMVSRSRMAGQQVAKFDYLDSVPQRFVFVFMPTHGSWLNLVENLFSKMTRGMLRGIRAPLRR